MPIGLIYKISYDSDMYRNSEAIFYIGSTFKTLKHVFIKHLHRSKTYTNRIHKYFLTVTNNNFSKVKLEILEKVDYLYYNKASKLDLLSLQKQYITNLKPALNMRVPQRYWKEYVEYRKQIKQDNNPSHIE